MLSGQQSKILIVDDIPTNIKVLYNFLQQVDFKVSIAKSAESALDKVEKILPDLIILDVMMPGMNGFEVCQRLKENSHTCEIPVIFMTALTDEVDKVKGLQLGAVDYITKPINASEVLARINVHLSLRKTTLQLQAEIAERKQTEQALQSTLDELKQAQMQLVHSEKMSSLGQLVAGIAHEINNPVNFIHGNLNYAEKYVQDLLTLVGLYGEHFPNPPAAIEAMVEDLELDYLKADLLKIVGSMKMGTSRIREIVLSLRNFSRLQEADFKQADIHEGIESTLTILQSSLRRGGTLPEIQVIKSYGQLPLIECYAGQLNQVFMNILGNAIEALNEHDDSRNLDDIKADPSQISIMTKIREDDWLEIHFSDNGCGIPEAVRSHIFDPFFTTKPVGKGTGLGLSISYKVIVEGHGGKIWCDSIPGKGTQFIIEIPVNQSVPTA